MKRFTGQRNLYVVGQYKQAIVDMLYRDKDFQLAVLPKTLREGIQKDIDENGEDSVDYESYFDEYVYDYAFSEDTAFESKVYTCIDITIPYADGTTFKDLYIYAYVFAPKNFVKWNRSDKEERAIRRTLESRGYCGNKVDMITDIIDRHLNGLSGMTIGKLTYAPRDAMTIFNAQQGYYGKLLTYFGSDFATLSPSAIRSDYKDGELDV